MRSALAHGLQSDADVVESAIDINPVSDRPGEQAWQMVLANIDCLDPPAVRAMVQRIRMLHPNASILCLLSDPACPSAAAAIEAGALDCLSDQIPWPLVRQKVHLIRDRWRLHEENRQLRSRFQPSESRSLPDSLADAVAECERATITAALAQCNHHRERTAKRLGISVRTLHYKMGRYSLH
ncbi:hypothetical protein FYK55_04080 [Roseiconus nitratireducens]|uniref:DNA binding HTH domain-containing protein n=1 Tax=Roseiconus nitratireducens TaxID=2605748 RepID=A0A5M6DFH4_9BACT|nr:hypothetical protein FYK55_04080 [Roseiconus nitratireducens]